VDRSAIFVLAACDDGPMIVARTDAHKVGGMYVGVGVAMLETGSHCQEEIDILLQLSKARACQKPAGGFTVLDIGANIGAHTVPWAKFMTGWGRIIAIEAQERLFGALWGNITINNCFNARAVWAAAADTDGVMAGPSMDYCRPANFGGVSMLPEHNDQQPVLDYKQIVPTITIDGLRLPRVDVIKIDVEGMEPQVLKGAAGTIAREYPIITAEHTTCGARGIIDALPHDYRCRTQGMNMLCMHRDDPIWKSVTGGVEAA
jgi:FkbM family methyltransferase